MQLLDEVGRMSCRSSCSSRDDIEKNGREAINGQEALLNVIETVFGGKTVREVLESWLTRDDQVSTVVGARTSLQWELLERLSWTLRGSWEELDEQQQMELGLNFAEQEYIRPQFPSTTLE